MILTEAYTFDEAKCKVHGGGLREDGSPKELFMEGIFIQGDQKNHNKRVYPVNEIRNAVSSINDMILKGESVLGEADHPEELNINLERVSHVIEKMWMDGPNGIGKLRILPTPKGNLIRSLLESNVKLGVSSRGSGNVDNGGRVSEFEIVTVDIVARPSAPQAYPRAVYETLYNSKRGKVIDDLATEMTYIKDNKLLVNKKAQKLLKEEIMSFFSNLKS